MQTESIVIPIELRAATDDAQARLVGVLLPIGRVAVDRQEIFTPGSVTFPSNGVRLLLEHRGRQVLRFVPIESAGEWRIDAELPDTPEGREAAELVKSGRRPALSVEMYVLADQRVSGVREVRSALVEATALCREGCYGQARAELRSRAAVKVWL